METSTGYHTTFLAKVAKRVLAIIDKICDDGM